MASLALKGWAAEEDQRAHTEFKEGRVPKPRESMIYVLMTAILVAVLAGCAPPTAAPQPTATPVPSPLSVSLLHTADTWGYVLPCG